MHLVMVAQGMEAQEDISADMCQSSSMKPT